MPKHCQRLRYSNALDQVTKDCRIAERRLVDVEEGVAHREVWEYHKIDLPNNFPLFCWINWFVNLVRRVEERHGNICTTCFCNVPFLRLDRRSCLVVYGLAMFRDFLVLRSVGRADFV